MLKFNNQYFLASVIILMVEVSIATVFKHLFFLRAYIGDVIVVVLIYTAILSFFKINNHLKLILGIFLFACFIEVVQYFKTADLLDFKPGSAAYIILGNSFSWIDILCYAAGCFLLLIFRKLKNSLPRFRH